MIAVVIGKGQRSRLFIESSSRAEILKLFFLKRQLTPHPRGGGDHLARPLNQFRHRIDSIAETSFFPSFFDSGQRRQQKHLGVEKRWKILSIENSRAGYSADLAAFLQARSQETKGRKRKYLAKQKQASRCHSKSTIMNSHLFKVRRSSCTRRSWSLDPTMRSSKVQAKLTQLRNLEIALA